MLPTGRSALPANRQRSGSGSGGGAPPAPHLCQLLHQLLDVHRQLVDKYGVVLAETNSENQLSVVKSQKEGVERHSHQSRVTHLHVYIRFHH